MEGYEIQYSVIYYYSKFNLEILNEIEKLLIKGIVVNLFLQNKFKEEFNLNEYKFSENLIYAKENYFLNIFDNLGQLDYKEGIIAYDGKMINEVFYKDICCCKYNSFNNEQYEIINAPENVDIIVTSGAGTGKTTTMINRLMFLRKIVKDFIFNKVVLITFTNEASIEMRERLVELLEKYYKLTRNIIYLDMITEVIESNISTIHSFAKYIIDNFHKGENTRKASKITTFKYYKKRFIEEGLDKFSREYPNIYERIKYYPLYDVVNKIYVIWGQLDNYSIDLNTNDFEIDFGHDFYSISLLIKYVLNHANNRLLEIRDDKIEVNDLIKKVSDIELIKQINREYKLIMVDEFQDIDNIQISFIVNFCKITKANIFVVGDEKQSIYRFRGAEHTAFQKLMELLQYNEKKLLSFTMIRNYRTESKLIEDINKLFINIDEKVINFNYKEKDYIYSLIEKEKANSIKYLSLKEEKDKVELLAEILEKKQAKESIAILVRNNNEVSEIKDICDINDIPCKVEVTGDFYRHEAVKDFYIMIKSLIYEKDSRINYSLINTPYIGDVIDKGKIIEKFNSEEDELFQYLNDILENNNWTYYREKVHFTNPLVLIDEIIDKVKPELNYYKKKLVKWNKNKKSLKTMVLEYKVNLDYLIYLLKKKFSINETSICEIEQFLRIKISTDKTENIRKLKDEYENEIIKCMTVHKAKGLEFDYVILPKSNNRFISNREVELIMRNENNVLKIGYKLVFDKEEFKNDYFGKFSKNENSQIIAEETRLFYVATTRCKKALYVDKNNISGNSSINSWENLISGGVENV